MQKTLYPSRSGGMPGPVPSRQIGWSLRPQRPLSPPFRGFFRDLVPRPLQNPLRFSASCRFDLRSRSGAGASNLLCCGSFRSAGRSALSVLRLRPSADSSETSFLGLSRNRCGSPPPAASTSAPVPAQAPQMSLRECSGGERCLHPPRPYRFGCSVRIGRPTRPRSAWLLRRLASLWPDCSPSRSPLPTRLGLCSCRPLPLRSILRGPTNLPVHARRFLALRSQPRRSLPVRLIGPLFSAFGQPVPALPLPCPPSRGTLR